MEERIITCIGCPMGCQLTAQVEDGKLASVTGYTCKRGKEYAEHEVTAPTRMVTSVLAVEGSPVPLCVKTAQAIPKALIKDCLSEIRRAHPALPIAIGDVIVPDVCGTGVNVVATRNLSALS